MINKQSGSVAKFLPILFSLVAMGILSFMFMDVVGNMDMKDSADIISRQYLLRMETTGYLMREDETHLIEELTDLGLENVNLSGTTLAEVDYGDIITLSIQATAHLRSYRIYSLFHIQEEKSNTRLWIKKVTTAKH